MRNSIFTYNKEKNCAYCAHNRAEQGTDCALQSEKQPCEKFRYDVFKRTPKKTPKESKFFFFCVRNQKTRGLGVWGGWVVLVGGVLWCVVW